MRRIPALPLPRDIAPENAQEGDMVTATYPVMRGCIVAMSGILHRRQEQGSRTHWFTREGAKVFTYIPGYSKNPRITLHSRAEYPQEMLSGLDSVKERIE